MLLTENNGTSNQVPLTENKVKMNVFFIILIAVVYSREELYKSLEYYCDDDCNDIFSVELNFGYSSQEFEDYLSKCILDGANGYVNWECDGNTLSKYNYTDENCTSRATTIEETTYGSCEPNQPFGSKKYYCNDIQIEESYDWATYNFFESMDDCNDDAEDKTYIEMYRLDFCCEQANYQCFEDSGFTYLEFEDECEIEEARNTVNNVEECIEQNQKYYIVHCDGINNGNSSGDGDGCAMGGMMKGNDFLISKLFVFRAFRDQTLSKYKLGRKFINIFQSFGDPVEEFLDNNYIVKKVCEVLMYPLVWIFEPFYSK